MKKYVLFALSLLTLFAFVACSNTVADISTSGGGEIEVTESDVGEVDETVNLSGGDTVTGEFDYESYTITYTDPEGYTTTEDGGGSVTFSLDGYEVGKIVYVPATVERQIMAEYYEALQADVAELEAYAAQYAEGLDVEYEVTKETVNGQEVILLTGTVAEGSVYGNPGDVAYVLVMPMGDQMIVLRGFADAETAEIIRSDMITFAESIQGEATASAASTSSSAA